MCKMARGFTLFEVMLALLVIGLLTGVITISFQGVLPAGRETVAVTKAREINGARRSFGMIVPDAATQWAAAATDADKVVLLINARLLFGTMEDHLTSSGGYTLSLAGAMRDKTILKKGALTINYKD